MYNLSSLVIYLTILYIYIYATSYSLFLGTEKIVLHINVPVSFLHLVSDRFSSVFSRVGVFSLAPSHRASHPTSDPLEGDQKTAGPQKKTHLGAPEHLQTRLSSGGRRRDGEPEEEEEEMESQKRRRKKRWRARRGGGRRDGARRGGRRDGEPEEEMESRCVQGRLQKYRKKG